MTACTACIAAVVALLSVCPVLADLDVNAVAGVATIGGSPAPAGTVIRIQDTTTGHVTSTTVDGPNIPPFQRGQGRFDTGDVPQFNTGDNVIVAFGAYDTTGQVQATLVAGTTAVSLSGTRNQAPSVGAMPAQSGTEDVPWELDLDPYIYDPDTPKGSLVVDVNNPRVTVAGHVLTFLYPEGYTQETVLVYVRDGTSTATGMIQVSVTPVNDPPVMGEIPAISIMEGSGMSLNLTLLAEDPDNAPGELTWEVGPGTIVEARVEGHCLHVSSTSSQIGLDSLQLTVSDPGGLSDTATVPVEVGANLTALMEYYQSVIDGLNAQILNLTEQNSALSSSMATLTSRVESLEDEKADLLALLEEAEGGSEDALEELEELRSRASQDQATIAGLEAEKQNLTARIAELEEELEEAEDAYRAVVEELNRTEELHRSQVAILEARLADIKLNLTQLQAEAASQESLLANLSLEKENLETLIDEKEGQISILGEDISDLASQFEKLGEEKAGAEQMVLEIEAAMESLRQQNQELLARLDEYANTVPAQEVQGNRSLNETNVGEPTMVEGLFGTAARLASGGMRLVSKGMGSALGIAVIAVIAIVSAVSIAARTSWARMGGGLPERPSTTGEFWRNIENRTRAGSQGEVSNSLRYLGVSRPSRSSPAAPAGVRIAGSAGEKVKEVEKTTESVVLKGERPAPPRRSRATPKKVFVNPRPISLRSQGYPVEREVRHVEKPPAAVKRPEPSPVQAPPSTARREPARPEARERPEVAAQPKARVPAAGVESGDISEVDREYIKMLVELGYTKEAEDELRKRSRR